MRAREPARCGKCKASLGIAAVKGVCFGSGMRPVVQWLACRRGGMQLRPTQIRVVIILLVIFAWFVRLAHALSRPAVLDRRGVLW